MSLTEFADVLPAETVNAWPHVVAVRPPGSVLMGGTALATHLRHRVSHDLDVFASEAFDPNAIEEALRNRGEFARTAPLDDPNTLNGIFGKAKVQFLAVPDQVQLRAPIEVAGMPVGSVEDIFATKLKVIGDRGELRDYFDLMCIERSGQTVEEGLQLFQARYQIRPGHESLLNIVRSLGYLDDVADDPLLAQSAGAGVRGEVAAYWRRRQPEIARSLDERGTSG